MVPHLPAAGLAGLQSLKNQVYPHKEAFTGALGASLGPVDFSVKGTKVLLEADLGRRYFLEKLGWPPEYRTTLEPYTQMLTKVRTLQHQLKQRGLTEHSLNDFIKQTRFLPLSERTESEEEKLLDYLVLETASLPADKALLGSSDIIESYEGKYKLFSAKSPLKHMGHLILTLPLLTAKLTAALICTALETVSFAAVSDWYTGVFGISSRAKRRAVFQLTITHIIIYNLKSIMGQWFRGLTTADGLTFSTIYAADSKPPSPCERAPRSLLKEQC